MFWNIVLFAALWMVGIASFGWFGLQILLCLFTSMPMIKLCHDEFGEDFDWKTAYKQTFLTMFVQLILLSVVVFLVFRFGNQYARIGYLVGAGISFLMSIGKWSWSNANNREEFMRGTFARNYHGEPTTQEQL